MDIERFQDFFRAATGVERAYPYQERRATTAPYKFPERLDVPTEPVEVSASTRPRPVVGSARAALDERVQCHSKRRC